MTVCMVICLIKIPCIVYTMYVRLYVWLANPVCVY